MQAVHTVQNMPENRCRHWRKYFKLTDGTIRINIELKTTASSVKLAEKVIELIHQYNMEDKCVITSFDYYALKYAKHYDTKIQTGYILVGGITGIILIYRISTFSA